MRDSERRARALLALGALAGLVLAGVGLLWPSRPTGASLPAGAVAIVNGEVIGAEALERELEWLRRSGAAPEGPDARRRVLERMIDEELLLQRAVELDIVRHDRRIRTALIAAVAQAAAAQLDIEAPDPDAVRAFYEANRERFGDAELTEVESEVRRQLTERKRQQALRMYLEELRGRADIRIEGARP